MMNVTLSMNGVLNFIHTLSLSPSNKKWLADHLYAEVKMEEETLPVSAVSVRPVGWPHVSREEMVVAPEVATLVKGFEIPGDVDCNQIRLRHLMKKHGL